MLIPDFYSHLPKSHMRQHPDRGAMGAPGGAASV